MKTLANCTILYDNECPLCATYTEAFVKTKMLDENGREPFTQVPQDSMSGIDWNRARNEIALVNRKDNTVVYGVESILQIVGHNFPIVFTLFRIPLIKFLVTRLYFFISYNRKVIAPGKVFEGRNACTPDLNYRYRWIYIVVTWFVTSLILDSYSRLLIPIVPPTNFYREFLICGGQILFQGTLLLIIKKERLIHYLGNVMTISLGGALLLLPMLLLGNMIQSPWIYLAYFFSVVSLMFAEHVRRVKILELPWVVSVSWLAYRFLVLFIIYYL